MSCPSTTYVTVRGTYCWEPSFAGQRCVLSTMSATTLWGANTRSGLRAYLRRRRSVSALSLNGKSVSGLATLAGWKSAGVRHALRAHGGPKRTDFKRRQAISLDPSGTLTSAGLFWKSAKRLGSSSRSNRSHRVTTCGLKSLNSFSVSLYQLPRSCSY